MLTKKIEELTSADIKGLVDNSVKESKTIEFKGNYKIDTGNEKGEFLADISSFSNALGGHIIYGIKEDGGMAKEVKDFEVTDTDAEKLRLENIIRMGIEPRIKADMHFLEMNEGKFVLIIYVRKSWLGPHRVIYTGNTKTKFQFYSRNSAGKYSLDILELKDAFNLNNTINEKIDDFVNNRIYKINIAETSIPMEEGGKIVMHLIPLESFTSPEQYDLDGYQNYSKEILPLTSNSGNLVKINLDGVFSYRPVKWDGVEEHIGKTYVQLYWNGIIEAVDGIIFNRLSNEAEKKIPGYTVELQLIEKLHQYLEVLKSLGVRTPVLLFLSFINVHNYYMCDGYGNPFNDFYKIDRDILKLPGVIINDFDRPSDEILKGSIDLLWNACGFMASSNYREGRFVRK